MSKENNKYRIYDGNYNWVEETAKSFLTQGNFEEAEKCYLLLQEKCEHNAEKDERWISELPNCYITISEFYSKSKMTDKAEFFLLKALDITKKLIKQDPDSGVRMQQH